KGMKNERLFLTGKINEKNENGCKDRWNKGFRDLEGVGESERDFFADTLMKIILERKNKMNYILKDTSKMNGFTDMRVIFHALDGIQKNYNWLITDIEYYPEVEEIKEGTFISGDELTKLVNQEDIQFIWAVFTGFEKDIKLDINNLEVVPYIKDHYDFWANVSIQHPQAMLEIDCCDSSYVTLLSKDELASQKFGKYFNEAIELV
ncbi:MAG: hypothetical protein N4A68_19935, partial [Maledivibacter sp.]|nr:hypothetical protein [Maledivibacter sp.]